MKLPALVLLTALLIALPTGYAVALFVLSVLLYFLAGVSLPKTVADHKLIFVFSLAAFAFHWGDLQAGLFNYLYLCSLFLLSFLFVFTTAPAEINGALVYFRLPKTTAFMLSTAIASIPYFENKARKVRVAQAARGSRAVLPLILPVLHSLFTRARNLAISLETRGFKP